MMQERRTTNRFDHSARAHYCPIDVPRVRDGRIANLSEKGVGLLTKKMHKSGEQITVTCALPHTREPFTATGTVRWSDLNPRNGRWYLSGLEWCPLEESNRNRLGEFLRWKSVSKPRKDISHWHSFSIYAATATGLLIGLLFAVWVLSLQARNGQLLEAMRQRDGVIVYLGQKEKLLQRELTDSKTQLAQAAGEVVWLNQQAQLFATDIRRLSEKMDQFQKSYMQIQQSYSQIKGEREKLVQRVLELEQERLELAQNLSSIPYLRQAIHDAILARRGAKKLPQRINQQSASGNQGYLMRAGRPTKDGSSLLIQVHEPESIQSR